MAYPLDLGDIMSKALTKARADLDALRLELETWIASAPPTPKPVRKPAVKRTRVQLVAAATAPIVEVDTSWIDLLTPAPVVPAAPLYVDATHLIRIELETPHVLDFPEAPHEIPARRTLRQAFLDGYNSYGN